MSTLFWNIRGLGTKGRKAQLKKILQEHQIKYVCISETIKQRFTNRELAALGGGLPFKWEWVPRGHSRGLLMGVDEDFVEVSSVESSDHFQAMTLTQKDDNFTWRLIHVYGPVEDNHKQAFLDDLEELIKGADIPTLIGGDFNLARRIEEKLWQNCLI